MLFATFRPPSDVQLDLAIADGVVDPVKVTRSAVVNASSVARMVLTTESAVVDKPEEAPEAGHGHGHAH